MNRNAREAPGNLPSLALRAEKKTLRKHVRRLYPSPASVNCRKEGENENRRGQQGKTEGNSHKSAKTIPSHVILIAL